MTITTEMARGSLTILMLGCLIAGTLVADEASREHLTLGDGSDWRFVTGGNMRIAWTENSDGVIDPLVDYADKPPYIGLVPQGYQAKRAFYTKAAYGDLTAEFDYKPYYDYQGSGHAGMILRAQDPNHFYIVYFPYTGQTLRSKNFLAAIGKVEGDGYIRNLGLVWVPNVPSESERWYRVRVEATGPKIGIWIDGRKSLTVSDDTYARGLVGLAGQGRFLFRNVSVVGDSHDPTQWNGEGAIPDHSFQVGLSGAMPSGCVAPNGEVLLAAGLQLVRSADQGRTWGDVETLPDFLDSVGDYGNTMFCTSSGRLMIMLTDMKGGDSGPEISISESRDNGHMWSRPVPSEVGGDWSGRPTAENGMTPYGPLVETEDGTLLRFFLYGMAAENAEKEIGGRKVNIYSWANNAYKAFAMRSTDGGQTWSGPIEIDEPRFFRSPRGTVSGSTDFTEPTGVAIGNEVMVTIRPVYSPYMWQCWSENSGETWDAASRTTFPGYAQSMIRLQSGVIVCGHRGPHYSINLSRDGGLNWDAGTVIDYRVWGMGCLVEVEPDTLLCTYMGNSPTDPLLAQRIRVTPEGLVPLPQGPSR
jgi:hypothetical protein